AILVGRADLAFLDALMAERAGLGATGRSFLVGTAMRPASSAGIKRALDGETGTAIYTSHDGRDVVGAFRPIKQIGVAIVAEMETHEAFAPIHSFRLAISALFVVVCIGAALIGVRLAL